LKADGHWANPVELARVERLMAERRKAGDRR
jgi:predicted TIM-barrel enzyme